MTENELLGLREREKELQCIYRINDIISQRQIAPHEIFLRLLEAIPYGWQEPSQSGARIEYLGSSFVGPGYCSSGHVLTQAICLWGVAVGQISVSTQYPRGNSSTVKESPAFLPEEETLLITIASRVGEYLEWKHTELFSQRVASPSVHWRWRQNYVEALARCLSSETFSVSNIYLGGSTESGNAGPGSDIDLYLVFTGTAEQKVELEAWLRGWSLCLAELSFQQTGYSFSGGILNIEWLESAPNLSLRTDLRELGVGELGV